MSRALLTLRRAEDRVRAMRWVRQAPPGTRVELKEAKRSLPQNDRFWAMCTDISRQKTINGDRYTPEQWRSILMQAWGKEVQHLPTLDGESWFSVYSSSDLAVAEMSDLLEFLAAWGAHNDVTFNEPAALGRRAA